jgi:hypothetical protein
MTEMAPTVLASSATQKAPNGPRAKSNKPTQMVWLDDPENPIAVTSWNALVKQIIDASLSSGLKVSQLPMKKAPATQDDPVGFFSPMLLPSHGYYVEVHGSAEELRRQIYKMVALMGKAGGLRVDTANGEVIEF